MFIKKYFSVETNNGHFIGFIEALNYKEAFKQAKDINKDYKITACLSDRQNKRK